MIPPGSQGTPAGSVSAGSTSGAMYPLAPDALADGEAGSGSLDFLERLGAGADLDPKGCIRLKLRLANRAKVIKLGWPPSLLPRTANGVAQPPVGGLAPPPTAAPDASSAPAGAVAPTLRALLERARAVFHLPEGAPLDLSYRDGAGDAIDLSTDEDVEEMAAAFKADPSVPRLVLLVRPDGPSDQQPTGAIRRAADPAASRRVEAELGWVQLAAELSAWSSAFQVLALLLVSIALVTAVARPDPSVVVGVLLMYSVYSRRADMLKFTVTLLWLSLGTDLAWTLLFGPLHVRPQDAALAASTHRLPEGLRKVYLHSNALAVSLTGIEVVIKLVILALEPGLRAVLSAQPLQPQLYAHWKPGARSAAMWLSLLSKISLVGAMLNSVVRYDPTLVACLCVLLGLHEQRRGLLLTAAFYALGSVGVDCAWLALAGLEGSAAHTFVEHPLQVEAHLAFRDQIAVPLTCVLLCAKCLMLYVLAMLLGHRTFAWQAPEQPPPLQAQAAQLRAAAAREATAEQAGGAGRQPKVAVDSAAGAADGAVAAGGGAHWGGVSAVARLGLMHRAPSRAGSTSSSYAPYGNSGSKNNGHHHTLLNGHNNGGGASEVNGMERSAPNTPLPARYTPDGGGSAVGGLMAMRAGRSTVHPLNTSASRSVHPSTSHPLLNGSAGGGGAAMSGLSGMGGFAGGGASTGRTSVASMLERRRRSARCWGRVVVAATHALLLLSLAGAAVRPDKSAAIAVWVLLVVSLDECALIEPDAMAKKVALSRTLYLVALSAVADVFWFFVYSRSESIPQLLAVTHGHWETLGRLGWLYELGLYATALELALKLLLTLLLVQYATATPLELVAQLALQCAELARWGTRVRNVAAAAVTLALLGCLLRPDPSIAIAAFVWWAAGPSVATVGGSGRVRTAAVLLLCSLAGDFVWVTAEAAHPISVDVLLELLLYRRTLHAWREETLPDQVALWLTCALVLIKLCLLLMLSQLALQLVPDESHAYVLGYMRAAHPPAVPFLLGEDFLASHAHARPPLRGRSPSHTLPGLAAGNNGALSPMPTSRGATSRRAATPGGTPTGPAAFGHLFRASSLLLVSATFASVGRLDPSLALAAMGAHCACFPARRPLSIFWALLVLSAVADALWLHLGEHSPLAGVGGLLALPPMCELGDWYGSWHALPADERGGLAEPPQLLAWARALPAPEAVAGSLVLVNLPLKLVVALLATGALWRMRDSPEH